MLDFHPSVPVLLDQGRIPNILTFSRTLAVQFETILPNFFLQYNKINYDCEEKMLIS